MDCECVKLTGSGRLAIAASIASYVLQIVSGGRVRKVPCSLSWCDVQLHGRHAVPWTMAQTLGKPAANYWPVAGLVLEGKQI
jgi:hypothetical protein